jgi:ribosomal silencing factor RsfS
VNSRAAKTTQRNCVSKKPNGKKKEKKKRKRKRRKKRKEKREKNSLFCCDRVSLVVQVGSNSQRSFYSVSQIYG